MCAQAYRWTVTSWEQIIVPGTRFTDVRRVAEIDSTNVRLLAMAKEGVPEGTVLVADHQLAGRGRLGRTWQAPPGASLLVSVLIRPPVDPGRAHLFTIAAALAAADACSELAGVRPDLKWPNDLVVGGGAETRKLAGLLAESVIGDGQLRGLVVGLGLNVSWPTELPDDLAEIAVALNHLSEVRVDRIELLVRWLELFDEAYGRLVAPDGRGAAILLARYRDTCATLGREVRVEVADRVLEGRAVDVSDHGHLLVEVGPDLVEVTAGDVVHVRPT